MESTRNEYLKQKGVSPKTYVTSLNIKECYEKETQKGDKFFLVVDEEGNYYSHFVNDKNAGWEKHLINGNKVDVFVKEVRKEDKTFRNIYPSASNPHNKQLT